MNAHDSVRWGFNALLTAGDVLSLIPALLSNVVSAEQLQGALLAHARTTLMSGGLIYFDEAGGTSDGGLPVHKVAIDLPVVAPKGRRTPGARDSALRYLLERSNRVLRPRTTRVDKPRHVIVTGAPGNGKTTLSKLIVQAHRAAFLRDSIALSDEQRTLIQETDQALLDLGAALPRHRRWPIQINLAEYAQQEGMDLGATLIRRMANDVTRKSDAGDIAPSVLTSWRNRWPWLVVLDGLDEVVEPALRRSIIEQVTEFANDCEAEDSDVFIVLTTRPMGFDERIAPTLFERIDLADLDVVTAVAYGERVATVRNTRDPDRRDTIIGRVRSAAKDDALRNLLRTPLQVLILTIIVEQAQELSPDRFGLFDGYFRTVMNREISKPGGLSALIRDHRQLIEEIHQRIGIELLARAEHGESTLSVISRQELRDITWNTLNTAGFQPDGADRQLLADLLNAATHRLVLLAPHGDDGYGFDVRSLQELMAGLYLTSESDETVKERLALTAAGPHWRNTWLFAAGKMFSQPQRHLHDLIVGLVESIDDASPQRLSKIAPIGPRLALDLIDDGMARARPLFLQRLTRAAVDVLAEASPADLPALTRAFVRFASSNDAARRWVEDGLRHHLAQPRPARRVAKLMQAMWLEACDELGAPVTVRGLSQIPVADTADIPAVTADRKALPPADEVRLAAVLEAIDAALKNSLGNGDAVQELIAALSDLAFAQALEDELLARVNQRPMLFRWLISEVLSRVNRAPIGDTILASDSTHST